MTLNSSSNPSFGSLYHMASSVTTHQEVAKCINFINKNFKPLHKKLDAMGYDVLVAARDDKRFSTNPVDISIEICEKIKPLAEDTFTPLMQINKNENATATFGLGKNLKMDISNFFNKINNFLCDTKIF